jgi:hypothetical protein
VAKAKAALPHLELDDLRYYALGTEIWTDRLLIILQQDDDAEPVARSSYTIARAASCSVRSFSEGSLNRRCCGTDHEGSPY